MLAQGSEMQQSIWPWQARKASGSSSWKLAQVVGCAEEPASEEPGALGRDPDIGRVGPAGFRATPTTSEQYFLSGSIVVSKTVSK